MVTRCIHDVYFNWVDGGSRSHEIPEYHEWKENDPVELYNAVPVVKVKPELFNALEDGYEEIPKELLEHVHKVANKINPQTHRKNQVEYCFVATDGERVIAINTEGDNKPNLKSRLVLRHYFFVVETLAPEMEVMKCSFTPEDYEMDDTLEGQLLSANPNDYIGLTRTEKEMKQIVLEMLYNLSASENHAEVAYWYIELFPSQIGKTKGRRQATMLTEMFSFLRKDWSKGHEEWGTLMVKTTTNDIFKDEWTRLVKLSNKKDKVEA